MEGFATLGIDLKVSDKTGEMVRSHGMLYKAMAQTVLLYGSDSWLVAGAMLKALEGFHYLEAQKIAIMTAWRMENREWE